MVAYGEQEAERLGLEGDARTALVEALFNYGAAPRFRLRAPSHAGRAYPFVGVRELEQFGGWPEELRTAILGHALYSGVPRTTHLAKALFACDELAGFLTACALVKPSNT